MPRRAVRQVSHTRRRTACPVSGGRGEAGGCRGERGRAGALGEVGLVLGLAVLLLLLEGVRLDVFAQGAGVGVALRAAQDLALVRFLQEKIEEKISQVCILGIDPKLLLCPVS